MVEDYEEERHRMHSKLGIAPTNSGILPSYNQVKQTDGATKRNKSQSEANTEIEMS